MDRRRFDFFYLELCCAVNARLPRYALWLAVEQASEASAAGGMREAILHFIDAQLDAFLGRERSRISPRRRRQLRRRIARHRPEFSTPSEVMLRLCAPLPG